MFVYPIALVLYLIIVYSTICDVDATVRVLDKGILPLEKNSIGIQLYLDVENNDHTKPCWIGSKSSTCCLNNDGYVDCDVMTVHGVNKVPLKPRDRRTLVFVYPTFIQYDQVGICELVLNYKCGFRKKRAKTVNLPLDTLLVNKKKKEYMKVYKHQDACNCDALDKDALNGCRQVNCEFKYLGEKTYYDYITNKCKKALVCCGNVQNELPDLVYLPESNTCRDLDNTLTIADIYALSSGLGVLTEPIPSKKKVRVVLESNCSTISQNLFFLRDMMCGKLCPLGNVDTSSYVQCCTRAVLSILSCVIALSALLLSLACCIHSVVWLYLKWANGDFTNCFKRGKKKAKKRSQGKPKDQTYTKKETTMDVETKDNKTPLLREVVVKDVPLGMRKDIVNLCDRIGNEVKWKKRYRIRDLGSQVNLREAESDSSSTTEYSSEFSFYDDSRKLMK